MSTLLSNTDFLDQLKNVFKNPNFWAPALAATVGAGAIGGISAGLSKRKIETPRQRRRRILRSILLPSLLTAGAAGLGGIGLAAANLGSYKFKDREDIKTENEIQKKREENAEAVNKWMGRGTSGLAIVGEGVVPVVAGSLTNRGMNWVGGFVSAKNKHWGAEGIAKKETYLNKTRNDLKRQYVDTKKRKGKGPLLKSVAREIAKVKHKQNMLQLIKNTDATAYNRVRFTLPGARGKVFGRVVDTALRGLRYGTDALMAGLTFGLYDQSVTNLFTSDPNAPITKSTLDEYRENKKRWGEVKNDIAIAKEKGKEWIKDIFKNVKYQPYGYYFPN